MLEYVMKIILYILQIIKRIILLNKNLTNFSGNKYNPFSAVKSRTYVWIDSDVIQ